ncbi:MAG: hypothetical protein L6R39_004058 [Caloplaca ligustica]|nr:MAG: hypothetical protein L6R39_004058 [Caloplaca ligustica]
MLSGISILLLTLGRNVNTTDQLDAGVRLLTAQVHNNNGALHLSVIKTWLDQNPYDVVTILLVNSDNVAASDLDTQFHAAAIKSYVFTPTSTATLPIRWPTLNDLIASGQRLVTFVADMRPSAAAPYLLNELTYVFENPFSVLSLSNFSCVPERPAIVQGQTSAAVQSGRLPLMNHFLDIEMAFGIQVPDVGNISVTNAVSGSRGNLGDAAAACTAAYGRAPTFILVDFVEQGSAMETVDRLNGVTAERQAFTNTTGGQAANPSGAATYTSSSGSSSIDSNGFFTIILTMGLALVMS